MALDSTMSLVPFFIATLGKGGALLALLVDMLPLFQSTVDSHSREADTSSVDNIALDSSSASLFVGAMVRMDFKVNAKIQGQIGSRGGWFEWVSGNAVVLRSVD